MCEDIRMRIVTESDIPVLLEMTNAEGWKYSETDLRAGLEVDPQGITVAVDECGQQLGFIGHFNLVDGMVYIDVFITRPDVRGKGIGKHLWKEMLTKHADKNIVLDAVIEKIPWYKKQGLVFEEHREHVYRGKISRSAINERDNIPNYKFQILTDDSWTQLLEYDKTIHNVCRERALRAWFNPKWSVTVIAMDAGHLVGYANFHKRNDSGYNMRALYANNQDVAESLLEAVLDKMTPSADLVLAVMDGKKLPRYEGFQYAFSVQRLSTRRLEPPNNEKIYIVTAHLI